MKTTIARVSAFAALSVTLAAFTGPALAGNGNANNGNGNGNSAAAGNPGTPPGQEKKADQSTTTTTEAPPAAEQPAPAAAAATTHGNPNAPGQQKRAAATPAATSPATSHGQEKQAVKAAASTPGVKPSNTTEKHTTCYTGGTATSATCTPGPKADSSKQYGNGKTAAQIAVSRGAPAGTALYGPGNSQPHKVAVCPHSLHGKGGGVDVHAVKSYSSTGCAPAVTSRQPAGQQPAPQQAAVQQPSVPVPQSLGVAAQTAGGTTATAPAATAAAAGVLGAEATLKTPAAKSGHAPGGVLGVTAKLGKIGSAGTLPFTGLPLWTAVLAALALIATGLALRTGRPAASS